MNRNDMQQTIEFLKIYFGGNFILSEITPLNGDNVDSQLPEQINNLFFGEFTSNNFGDDFAIKMPPNDVEDIATPVTLTLVPDSTQPNWGAVVVKYTGLVTGISNFGSAYVFSGYMLRIGNSGNFDVESTAMGLIITDIEKSSVFNYDSPITAAFPIENNAQSGLYLRKPLITTGINIEISAAADFTLQTFVEGILNHEIDFPNNAGVPTVYSTNAFSTKNNDTIQLKVIPQ